MLYDEHERAILGVRNALTIEVFSESEKSHYERIVANAKMITTFLPVLNLLAKFSIIYLT